MDFRFLYDPTRKLFSIGLQVDSGRLDPGYYDLLASEARLASFIAIAKHEVPPAHWFRLARPMISLGDDAALVSWSGSMFEYLMPSLLLRLPFGSLLDHTCRAIVAAADPVRIAARGAVGYFRVGVQQARRASDVSVFELRHSGSGTQARSR